MVECPECGNEQESGDFCGFCGYVINLDYPNPKQITQNEVMVRKSRIYERLGLFLFRSDVREDLCQRNFAIETFLVWILIFLISGYTVYYSNSHASIRYITGYTSVLRLFLDTLVQLVLVLVITSIMGLVANSHLKTAKIFQIYTYNYLWVVIIQGIYLTFTQVFFDTAVIYAPFFFSINWSVVLPYFILPVGYTTLFKTNYWGALIIVLIILFVSIIPLQLFSLFTIPTIQA